MLRRDLIILLLLGILTPLITVQFQALPGYMDADYYFGGGLQLIKGNGFTDPYVWNYLSDPEGLPTPSHAYWMPLASIIAALGMLLTGQASYFGARIGFIFLSGLIPPLTSVLAYQFTTNRTTSFLSGMLACFPIYYAPFLPVTDNYSLYMVLGISYFLLLNVLRKSSYPLVVFFLLGMTSGLLSLARSDGYLWLGISLLVAIWYVKRKRHSNFSPETNTLYNHPNTVVQVVTKGLFYIVPILAGFLLLMFPWYARNTSAFGSWFAQGGSRVLWLREYNDTFVYPASQLTMQYWLESGGDVIIQTRLRALGLNLLNAFAAQGGIFLFPFILIGLWLMRKDYRVRIAIFAWFILLGTMTLIFPYSGPRGAFFHAGAALQPVWWVAAPLGLDSVNLFIRKRAWLDDRAYKIFRVFLIVTVVVMTAYILYARVINVWEREDSHYIKVENILNQYGAGKDDVVIVRNPPGYYVVTGRSAIALPTNGIPAIFQAAGSFQARYLILEPEGLTTSLRSLYNNPDIVPGFQYLGESDGNLVFEIIL